MTQAERSRIWYLKNKSLAKERALLWQKKYPERRRIITANNRKKRWADYLLKATTYNRKRRAIVLNHYGKVCACCNEKEEKFLTVDHINGGGSAHNRRLKSHGGSRLIQWLIKNKFPAGFRILCFNCNCGRARNKGVCPHAC